MLHLTPTRRELLDQVRAFAATRLGFFTSGDAHSLGVAATLLRSWCDTRTVHRIFKRVHHIACAWEQLDREQRIVARLLAAGSGAALTRLAGIEFAGGTRFEADVIDIVVPSRRRIALPGTRLHVVEDLASVELQHPRGCAVTSDPWSLAELGKDFTSQIGPYQIANAIHAVNYRARTTDLADRIEKELDLRRHVGAPIVRAGLELHRSMSAGTRSRTEDRWLEMALRAWHRTPLVNCAHAFTRSGYEIDFLYERERLRVELDGGQHGRIKDVATDRASDAWYHDSGVSTLRETWESVWYDLDGCRRRLLAALTRRR